MRQDQKTSLELILGVMYVEYGAALEMCALQTLHDRREHRSLQFALKCIKHPTNKSMFPTNPSTDTHAVRNREIFNVNRAHTESYNKSTIPFLQRKLNTHFSKLAEQKKGGAVEINEE